MSEDAPVRYSKVTTALHWLGAILIVGLMIVGQLMETMDGPERLQLLDLHRKAGLATGFVFLLRIIFFVTHKRPESDPSWPRWQAVSAKLLHILLYILPLVMVGSGMAALVGFGLGSYIESSDIEGYMAAKDIAPLFVHGLAAKLLMGGVVLHVAAALHHHFVQKDGIFGRISLLK